MKICPGGCSMQKNGRNGGRMDMTKLIVAFPNFVNAPKEQP
jgi:hypothetical protein